MKARTRFLAVILILFALAGCGTTGGLFAEREWQSELVRVNPDGSLSYRTDGDGHRIPDFSYVGYHRGERPLPDVRAVAHVMPSGRDDTAAIQEAIDMVATAPLGDDGFRGAVELSAGVFEIHGTIRVNASGVVLRGAGDEGANRTLLRAVGESPADRDVIVAGSGTKTRFADAVPGTERTVISALVPLGERRIEIESTDGYSVGDNIVVHHRGGDAWIRAIDYGGVIEDEPWGPYELPVIYNRYVEAIDGNTITLDAPLYMTLDTSLADVEVYVHDTRRIEREIGIEDLAIEIVPSEESQTDHAMNAIALSGVQDAWVRNVTVSGYQLSGVIVETGVRVTVADAVSVDPIHPVIPGYLYNFNAGNAAQQILFTNCHAENGRHHYIVNGASLASGIVFHNTTSEGAWNASEGHRRWSTGILFDRHRELDWPRLFGGQLRIGLLNRADLGTGHGWSAVNSVLWNVEAENAWVVVQKPPLAQNFAIGVRGLEVSGAGYYRSPAGYVEGANRSGLVPESLYEAQLSARLHKQE